MQVTMDVDTGGSGGGGGYGGGSGKGGYSGGEGGYDGQQQVNHTHSIAAALIHLHPAPHLASGYSTRVVKRTACCICWAWQGKGYTLHRCDATVHNSSMLTCAPFRSLHLQGYGGQGSAYSGRQEGYGGQGGGDSGQQGYSGQVGCVCNHQQIAAAFQPTH